MFLFLLLIKINRKQVLSKNVFQYKLLVLAIFKQNKTCYPMPTN